MHQAHSIEASLLSDLMSTNALGAFRDERRKDAQQASLSYDGAFPGPQRSRTASTASNSGKPSYFPDSDLMSAPDVQLRYNHTLPVSTSASANHSSDGEDQSPSSNRRKAPAAPATVVPVKAKTKTPPKPLGKDDVLKDRLQKAQQAFASLREPTATQGGSQK
jgi:hypothetical protein